MTDAEKPRVLIVDDDPNLRAAFKRTLSKVYTIDAAGDGESAVNALKRCHNYQVIIVDMNMPGMSGLRLLAHAHRLSPDTVRIMLTGSNDQKVAADAVNAGRVFRFLHKPCTGTDFMAAMNDALQLYQANKREREMFEETFQGMIKVLTEVLSAVEPAAFGRGQHLAQRACAIASRLNVTSTWEIETAATLLRIGVVTIPGAVLKKQNSGTSLSHTEQQMIARIPETGANLLGNLPRLAPVAQIVRYHRKRFDGSGPPDETMQGDDIPLGARIFCALLDLEAHEIKGLPIREALRQLERESRYYDPLVLKAMAATLTDSGGVQSDAMYLTATELQPGMKLTASAMSDENVTIIPAGTTLTEMLIDRLRNFANVDELQEPLVVTKLVEDPDDSSVDTLEADREVA